MVGGGLVYRQFFYVADSGDSHDINVNVNSSGSNTSWNDAWNSTVENVVGNMSFSNDTQDFSWQGAWDASVQAVVDGNNLTVWNDGWNVTVEDLIANNLVNVDVYGDWTIRENGSTYDLLNGSVVEYSSGNLCSLLNYTGNSAVSVELKKGTYNFSGVYEITDGRVHFEGESYASRINFSAGSYFSITKDVWDGQLEDVSFNFLTFDGNDVDHCAISSAGMGNNTRLRHLAVTNCRFDGFNVAGAHILELMNLEESRIRDCLITEVGVGGAGIYLNSSNYEVGNVWIEHGDMMYDVAPCVEIENTNTLNEAIGGVWIDTTHFLGSGVAGSEAVLLKATSGVVANIHLTGIREENGELLDTVGVGVGIRFIYVSDGYLYSNFHDCVMIHADSGTTNLMIYENQMVGHAGGSNLLFDDDMPYNGDGRNEVFSNKLQDCSMSLAAHTIHYDNKGYDNFQALIPNRLSGLTAWITGGLSGQYNGYTDIDHATDDDYTTATEYSYRNCSASGGVVVQYGFDMGATYSGFAIASFGFYSNVSSIYINSYWKYSADNSTWVYCSGTSQNGYVTKGQATSEMVMFTQVQFVRARYVIFEVQETSSTIAQNFVRLYEAKLLDLESGLT